jgi:hypothetical protein
MGNTKTKSKKTWLEESGQSQHNKKATEVCMPEEKYS